MYVEHAAHFVHLLLCVLLADLVVRHARPIGTLLGRVGRMLYFFLSDLFPLLLALPLLLLPGLPVLLDDDPLALDTLDPSNLPPLGSPDNLASVLDPTKRAQQMVCRDMT